MLLIAGRFRVVVFHKIIKDKMGIIKNATFFTIMLHFLLSVIIIGGILKYFIVKVKKF